METKKQEVKKKLVLSFSKSSVFDPFALRRAHPDLPPHGEFSAFSRMLLRGGQFGFPLSTRPCPPVLGLSNISQGQAGADMVQGTPGEEEVRSVVLGSRR